MCTYQREPRYLPGNSNILYLAYSGNFSASAASIHILQKEKNVFEHKIQQELTQNKEEEPNASLHPNVKRKMSCQQLRNSSQRSDVNRDSNKCGQVAGMLLFLCFTPTHTHRHTYPNSTISDNKTEKKSQYINLKGSEHPRSVRH